jgi:hypothetical protein
MTKGMSTSRPHDRSAKGAAPRGGQPLRATGRLSLPGVRQVDVDELSDELSSPSPSQWCVADAEVVAFVDAEPLELDAALAWARPVKPARITPPPTAATSERRTRDLKGITSFGHLADTPPSPPSDRLGLGRESAQRLHVRGGGRVEAPTCPGRRGGRPGYAYRERP